MKHRKTLTTTLSVSLFFTVFSAKADDAPGFFKIPGTTTSLKIYGYAALDAFYDFDNKLGNYGTIIDAINLAKANGTTDSFAPTHAWSMTANRSRIGFMTTTPIGSEEVDVKVEGDFLPGNFRLRHAYGSFGLGEYGGGGGTLLFGKTWSTFFDLDAVPETVDFTGAIGASNFDTPRVPMLRYTIPFTKATSLALAIEQDQTGSTGAPFPGGAVGMFTFSQDWGHVSVSALAQQYSTFIGQTPVTPELKYKKTALAWQLSGNVKFGKDNFQWDVLSGKGLGAYGAGFQSVGLNDFFDQTYHFWKSTGVALGYAHPWNDTMRSNLVLSSLWYKRDNAFTVDSDIHRIDNAFVNLFVGLKKNVELGVEYVYGRATSFGKALVQGDGSATDKIKESRVQMSLQVNFF